MSLGWSLCNLTFTCNTTFTIFVGMIRSWEGPQSSEGMSQKVFDQTEHDILKSRFEPQQFKSRFMLKNVGHSVLIALELESGHFSRGLYKL